MFEYSKNASANNQESMSEKNIFRPSAASENKKVNTKEKQGKKKNSVFDYLKKNFSDARKNLAIDSNYYLNTSINANNITKTESTNGGNNNNNFYCTSSGNFRKTRNYYNSFNSKRIQTLMKLISKTSSGMYNANENKTKSYKVFGEKRGKTNFLKCFDNYSGGPILTNILKNKNGGKFIKQNKKIFQKYKGGILKNLISDKFSC